MNIIVNKPKPATAQTTEKMSEKLTEGSGVIVDCYPLLDDFVELPPDFLKALFIQRWAL